MYVEDPYDAVDKADALLVLTEWPSFKELDYAAIKSSMTTPMIVDARNLLDPKAMKSLGFSWLGIGRS